MADRFARIAAVTAGALFIGSGVWAVVSPHSFYNSVAAWPPFNTHFVHDLGAFQIGLGVVLLLALIHGDPLFVALAGAGVGQGVHTAVHVMDRDLGGRATDPLVMAVLAVVLLEGSFLRARSSRRDG